MIYFIDHLIIHTCYFRIHPAVLNVVMSLIYKAASRYKIFVFFFPEKAVRKFRLENNKYEVCNSMHSVSFGSFELVVDLYVSVIGSLPSMR